MAENKKKGKGHRGSEVKPTPKGSGGPPSVKAREDKAKSTKEPPPKKYGADKKKLRYGFEGKKTKSKRKKRKKDTWT